MHETMPHQHKRALVLGGGGSVGNAWLIGVIAGLFDAGLDVTGADLVIGTSAGSTAAAQILAATPPELLRRSLATPAAAGHGTVGKPGPSANHLDRMRDIIVGAEDAPDMRRRMGAAAQHNASDDLLRTNRRATVAARLPSPDWPQRRMLITAVDADTGEPVVFDRHSGIELVDAVVASTANGFSVPPHRIGSRHYIDGGYRRNENADLAAGYGRVLVLSPFGGRSLHPEEWGMELAAQVAELRAGGSKVETVFPDHAALAAFGDNMMDVAARPPAARAGYDQGTAGADQLGRFWR